MTAEEFNERFKPSNPLSAKIREKGIKVGPLAVALGMTPTYLGAMLCGHSTMSKKHQQMIEMILEQIE